MDSLLISADVQRTIFAILSSVLHLGNVEFVGRDEAKVEEKSQATIKIVSGYDYHEY